MSVFSRPGYRKILFIASFILFGLVLGFLSIKFDRQYDQWFPLNIPGIFINDYLGNHILASVLIWAAIGTLLVLIFRPKIVAWIMGVYLVVFGSLWAGWESLHW